MRESITKPLIILDGNSIPLGYTSNLVTGLNSLYGVGNYDYVNLSVGGQTLTDMIADYKFDVFNRFGGFRRLNILMFQELRNEMQVNGATPAQAFALLKTYVQNIKNAWPTSFGTLKICPITAIADNDQGANINIANQLVRDDVSGDFSSVLDLYNYSTFNDYTSSLFDADETHMSAAGKTAAGSFLSSQIYSLYP